MHRLLTILLLVTISFSSVLSVTPEVEDGVYVLTDSTFDDFVKGEAFTIVEFYAPWCGHCKKLTPEWSKAAKALANEEPVVKLAKLDATVEKEAAGKFDIKGYPTIKIFRNGEVSDYEGPREADGIVRYIRSKSGPSSRHLEDADAAAKFASHPDQVTVIFYGDESDSLLPVFKEIADHFREDIRFGYTHAKDAAHSNSIVIHQAGKYFSKLEQVTIPFEGKTKEELISFLTHKILPLAGEITPDNVKLYSKRELPVAKVYMNLDWERDPKGATYHLNRIRKVAKDFVDKITFAIAGKKHFAHELRDLDVNDVDTPVVIHDLKTNEKFRLDQPAYTPESLKQLVEHFISGKLEPFIKSEAIPEKDETDVRVVVGKNFISIVNDPSKDVLIEVYAPWCGHCKSLAPKWEELASKLKGNSDTLVIAKIDATANSLPPNYDVKGFPSIFLVRADNKKNPIKYEGAREVEDFLKFLHKEAHFPIKE